MKGVADLSTPSRPSFTISPYALLILPPLFWGSNAVLGRFVVDDIPPMQLSLVRWFGALVVLVPLMGSNLMTRLPLIRDNWRRIMLLSLLSLVGFGSLFYVGLQTTTAINAGLLQSFTPVVILVMSWFILSTPVTGLQCVGLLFSLVGVAVVICQGSFEFLLSLQLREGDFWVLGGVLCWGLYSTLLRSNPVPFAALELLTLQIVFALVVLVPLAAVEAVFVELMTLDWTGVFVVLFIGLFPGVVAISLWIKGIKAVGAAAAGYYLNLVPVFAALFAVPVLGEAPGWYHLAGALLICAGIFLAVRANGRSEK